MNLLRRDPEIARRERFATSERGSVMDTLSRSLLLAAALLIPASAALGAAPAGAANGSGIWSFSLENSSVSVGPLPDRNYTNGLGLDWTSAVGALPAPLAGLGRTLFGPGQERISLGLFQQIFTPDDTQANPPSPFQRPYAGYLALHAALLDQRANVADMLALDIGLVGPAALGEQVQNGFHRLIGQNTNKGWGSQLRDEPTLEIYGSRTWRIPLGKVGGIESDLLPAVSLGIGSVRIYGEAGTIVRIGHGLAADFGPNRLPPATGGSPIFAAGRPFAWYVFIGADGQAVAHDLFLAGNTFSAGPHVTANPFLGTFEVGIALIIHGFRVSYTQVFQTKAWHGQGGSMFNFGALEIAARF